MIFTLRMLCMLVLLYASSAIAQSVITPGQTSAKSAQAIVCVNPITFLLESCASAGGGTSSALLSATHTDTLPAAVVRGSLIAGNATPLWASLAIGVNNRVLFSNGTDPSWSQIPSAALNITTTTCSNQVLTALTATAGGTCSTLTLASAMFANQGTTTTVLHGNGAGNPAFSSIVSADLNVTTNTCTNQFPRSSSATNIWTCATVATADVVSALVSLSKSVTIDAPTTGATNKIQWEFPSAITLTEIICSTDTGTVTIQLDKRARATPNTAGTDAMTSTLVCDSDSQATTSFSSSGVSADAPLNLQITAIASSPGVVRVHAQYTVN